MRGLKAVLFMPFVGVVASLIASSIYSRPGDNSGKPPPIEQDAATGPVTGGGGVPGDLTIQYPKPGNMPPGGTRSFGRHALPLGTKVWLVLQDRFGNYYLQNPPVRLEKDGTWSQDNVVLGRDIVRIIVVKVTPEGDSLFRAKVARHGFEGFPQLPEGSTELDAVRIEITEVAARLLVQITHFNDRPLADTYEGPVFYGNLVRGQVSGRDLNLYLIVQTQFGDYYVQPPVFVSRDGSWMGCASLGEPEEGIGQRFRVVAILTSEKLSVQQRLPSFPQGAIESNDVSVNRNQHGNFPGCG